MQEGKTQYSTDSAILIHQIQSTRWRRLEKLLRLIKYLQEKRDDKLALNINDMNTSYWYDYADFVVHADMKNHT